MRHRYRRRKMKPYCGWRRAKKEIETDMNDASCSFEQLRKSATLLCQNITEALRTKGLKAYVGHSWDGSHEYNDAEYWYLYPRDNGGVGLYCEYNRSNNSGTYDAGYLDVDAAKLAPIKIGKIKYISYQTRSLVLFRRAI